MKPKIEWVEYQPAGDGPMWHPIAAALATLAISYGIAALLT